MVSTNESGGAAQHPAPDGMPLAGWGLFLRRFLHSPRTVGAVTPSSRFLASRMVEPIIWGDDICIVEFGPGTGPFTKAILDRLPGQSRYLGIEREAAFVDMLRRRFPDAEFYCDSVENLLSILELRGLKYVDHIVSGLPFASLPRAVIHRVLGSIEGALAGGGTFTTFQYLHAVPMPSARLFRREMRRRFGAPSAIRFEFRNVPPALVFTWTKEPTADRRATP